MRQAQFCQARDPGEFFAFMPADHCGASLRRGVFAARMNDKAAISVVMKTASETEDPLSAKNGGGRSNEFRIACTHFKPTCVSVKIPTRAPWPSPAGAKDSVFLQTAF